MVTTCGELGMATAPAAEGDDDKCVVCGDIEAWQNSSPSDNKAASISVLATSR